MLNGWKINEKVASNGMHVLEVYVDGKLVAREEHGSMRYLKHMGNRLYVEHGGLYCQ